MSVVIMQYIFSIILQFTRTKNVPWHILAPAAVACDICIVLRSAHPRGAFLCNRNEVSYYIKNKAYEDFSVCPRTCFYYSRLSEALISSMDALISSMVADISEMLICALERSLAILHFYSFAFRLVTISIVLTLRPSMRFTR